MAKVAKRLDLQRGGDDVSFLPSRQATAPVTREVARVEAADFMAEVERHDAQDGGVAHDEGTGLVKLYLSHVDRGLGFHTFDDFLDKHWPRDRSLAYDRMRVARLMTRAQAVRYRFTACQLGLRVMAAMGIDSISTFLKTPLPLPADRGGGTIRFPAPATELRAVLRRLARPVPAPPGQAEDVGARLVHYQQVVAEQAKSDPGIAALKPVVYADAKGAYVRVTAGTRDQHKAAARLYQRLARG